MTDELLLILADMADISPKKVRMIVDAYEKAKTGYKPVQEGYTIFEYEGKRYAYKELGDGPWTPQCTSLELMEVLKNYFVSSGMMEEHDKWPGSSCFDAWSSDMSSCGLHVALSSGGGIYGGIDGDHHARFAVLPL